ncbi:MAG: PIN domain-containing protein [Planctomycetaceae bacterium]
MTDYVVDTDVISFFLRHDSRAEPYRPYLEGVRPVISFMTLAEIQYGAARAGWGTTRTEQMLKHLQQCIVFHETVELCRIWAQLRAEVESGGRHLSPSDAWIAATAVLLDLPLLSHNRKDYESVSSLSLISFG